MFGKSPQSHQKSTLAKVSDTVGGAGESILLGAVCGAGESILLGAVCGAGESILLGAVCGAG